LRTSPRKQATLESSGEARAARTGSANSPEAQRLYERFGFEVWGREPEATEHDRRRYDEIHMTLRLRA
jgi:L-amino acid N-acyltransferase YncA